MIRVTVWNEFQHERTQEKVKEIYPDFEVAYAQGLKDEDIEKVMEDNRVALNQNLPAYSQIARVKIYPEEFEKTPKKSIKRFLYQDVK